MIQLVNFILFLALFQQIMKKINKNISCMALDFLESSISGFTGEYVIKLVHITISSGNEYLVFHFA